MVVLVLVGSGDGSMDCLTFFLPCHHSHTREYALVSLVDPNCKDEWAQRVDKLEELPKLLAALFREPAYIEEEEERGEAGEERWEYDAEGIARPVAAVPRRAPAASNGGELEWVYVRVLRPAGPTYTVLELPGLPAPPGAEGRTRSWTQGCGRCCGSTPPTSSWPWSPSPTSSTARAACGSPRRCVRGVFACFVGSGLLWWGGGVGGCACMRRTPDGQAAARLVQRHTRIAHHHVVVVCTRGSFRIEQRHPPPQTQIQHKNAFRTNTHHHHHHHHHHHRYKSNNKTPGISNKHPP